MDWSNLLQAEAASVRENRGEWSGELGGKSVTLYARPLTPADHEFLAKRGHRDFLVNVTLPAMVLLIARKAEDESGQKAFKLGKDVPLLERIGQDKIAEIFSGLFAGSLEEETEESFEARVEK